MQIIRARGRRRLGGAKLNQALVWNVRTYAVMRREKAQAAQTARPKAPMRRLGADCSVVASKRGNVRGAKGAGHRHRRGSTGNGRNPMINGRRQPSRGDTSRMTRECQVRFCERLGVQFPGPTRQKRTSCVHQAMSALPPKADIRLMLRYVRFVCH